MRILGLLLSLFFTLISGSITLTAQSNQFVDELLAEERATFGRTVYLTLLAVNLVTEDTSIEESLTVLQKRGWGIKLRASESPINLGEYSLLLMKAFNIPGGLFYHIFTGPRYACRELAYLGFIKGNSSPFRDVSGEEVLQMLGYVLEWREERS